MTEKRRIDKATLLDLYVDQGLTMAQVARKLHTANSVVSREIKRHGVKIKSSFKTHGLAHTRPYKIWLQMKNRCSNSNNSMYHRYGAKGISYCKEWEQFENFWTDMKDTYKDGLTLDRKDGDKNYNPENCRWATYKEQNNNRSCCLSWDTCAKDVMVAAGISQTRVYCMKRKGLTDKQIIDFYRGEK